jgi:hypothetical protein
MSLRIQKNQKVKKAETSNILTIPKVDITQAAPVKGALVYNVDDNLYYGDGHHWLLLR